MRPVTSAAFCAGGVRASGREPLLGGRAQTLQPRNPGKLPSSHTCTKPRWRAEKKGGPHTGWGLAPGLSGSTALLLQPFRGRRVFGVARSCVSVSVPDAAPLLPRTLTQGRCLPSGSFLGMILKLSIRDKVFHSKVIREKDSGCPEKSNTATM